MEEGIEKTSSMEIGKVLREGMNMRMGKCGKRGYEGVSERRTCSVSEAQAQFSRV